MAGHSYLSEVKEPGTARAIRDLMDRVTAAEKRIGELQAQLAAVRPSSGLDAQGNRVVRVGDPKAGDDACNLRTARAIAQAQVGSFS